MVTHIKNKRGATLIELIMVILVVTIIAATTSGVVLFFVRLFFYNPSQLETQRIGEILVHEIVEGNSDARGVRFARTILDASATQFSYTYGYPATVLSVRFRWDNTNDHIYRSTSTDTGSTWSSETLIPPDLLTSTTIDGKDTAGVIFTYKKADDSAWTSGVDALGDIRRVVLGINVKTGTGSFDALEGSVDITSGVEIKGF